MSCESWSSAETRTWWGEINQVSTCKINQQRGNTKEEMKRKKEIKWKQLPLFSITCKNKTERKMKWTIKIKNKREREKNLISFSDRSLLLAQLHLGFNIQRECTVRWLTGVRGVPKLHVRSYSQCAHHVSYIYLDYVHSTNLWRHALDWNLVCYEK